jgi:hypothetical protein
MRRNTKCCLVIDGTLRQNVIEAIATYILIFSQQEDLFSGEVDICEISSAYGACESEEKAAINLCRTPAYRNKIYSQYMDSNYTK